MRCAANSYYDTYHVLEPRPGELALRALQAANGRLQRDDGTVRYRLVDADGDVVLTGTRDECLDAFERAWWRAEAATLAADRVAAASHAARLSFQRWGAVRGFEPDLFLTGLEMTRHATA